MKIYQSLEDLMQDSYLDILTMVDMVRYIAMNDDSVVLNDDKDIGGTFNEYLEILVNYDFYDKETKATMLKFIEQKKNNFFEKQEMISKSKYNEIYELNKKFISIYWEDLYVFKKFDIISDMCKDLVVNYHNQHLGEKVTMNSIEFISNQTDMTIYSISREDKSAMSICIVFLTQEQKSELIEFYIDENKVDERVDYEEYIRGQLSA